MPEVKPSPLPIYHKVHLLCGFVEYIIWVDTNEEFAKAFIQSHRPKDSYELARLINEECKRVAAIVI